MVLKWEHLEVNVLCARLLTRAGTDGNVRVDGPRDIPEITHVKFRVWSWKHGHSRFGEMQVSVSPEIRVGLAHSIGCKHFCWIAMKIVNYSVSSANLGSFLKFKNTRLVTEEAHYLEMLGKYNLAHVFCKGPENKCFSFCGSDDLRDSAQQVQWGSSHIWHISKYIWLSSNKTLFIKQAQQAWDSLWALVYQLLIEKLSYLPQNSLKYHEFLEKLFYFYFVRTSKNISIWQ